MIHESRCRFIEMDSSIMLAYLTTHQGELNTWLMYFQQYLKTNSKFCWTKQQFVYKTCKSSAYNVNQMSGRIALNGIFIRQGFLHTFVFGIIQLHHAIVVNKNVSENRNFWFEIYSEYLEFSSFSKLCNLSIGSNQSFNKPKSNSYPEHTRRRRYGKMENSWLPMLWWSLIEFQCEIGV